MAVVLANVLASTLLSFMSVKKIGPVINSLDELAHHSNEIKLIMPQGVDMANRFLVTFINLICISHCNHQLLTVFIRILYFIFPTC